MPVELTPELATEVLTACGVGGTALSARRLDGGVSNLSWRIERDGEAPVALRVERDRGIFQPYDVRREARVLRCLANSAVPVPEVLGEAGPESPLGAACIVLAWIDAPHMGQVPMTANLIDAYRSAVETIHAVDWQDLGLGFLDPPDPGSEAALRDLSAVHARAADFGCDGDSHIAHLAAVARRHLPNSPPPRLCHGDINVFNYLVGVDEQIVGVVDWEQANLGDPLSDWGLITALASLRGLSAPPEAHPLAAPAFARLDRNPADLRYWMLHQIYKLAVIHRIWSQIGDIPPWYTWDDVLRVSDEAIGYLEG